MVAFSMKKNYHFSLMGNQNQNAVFVNDPAFTNEALRNKLSFQPKVIEAHLVRLFDAVISPRCYALIVNKSIKVLWSKCLSILANFSVKSTLQFRPFFSHYFHDRFYLTSTITMSKHSKSTQLRLRPKLSLWLYYLNQARIFFEKLFFRWFWNYDANVKAFVELAFYLALLDGQCIGFAPSPLLPLLRNGRDANQRSIGIMMSHLKLCKKSL